MKKQKATLIHILLSSDEVALVEWLRDQARKHERTLTQQVRYLLRQAMEQDNANA